MTLRPQALPPVPEATVAAVQAAFPKGNRYVELRAEFGILYEDQLVADLYPPSGRPVEVAPWRLALVMVMQYIEGLADRITLADRLRHRRPAARGRRVRDEVSARGHEGVSLVSPRSWLKTVRDSGH